jgi:tetratricopeptide (TPR) repeat protein
MADGNLHSATQRRALVGPAAIRGRRQPVRSGHRSGERQVCSAHLRPPQRHHAHCETLLRRANGVKNVLPWVNKALGVFQWKQDMPQAEDLCKEALEMDPECDVAIATLAQLSLQQGKISEAIDWFEKSAKLARTEVELTTAITCESAAVSKSRIGLTDQMSVTCAR